ncbi:MAG: geranylgeranylglycerol-phosphate geranylgeranyltransferase [Candidatus Methanomethylophilaceae archaeon]
MNRYLRLFRFGNGVMGIVGVVVGAFIASGFDIADYWSGILVSCLIVFIFMAGGNAINDYIDREIDLAAHPERPVPRGEIAPGTARNLGVLMMLSAMILGILALIVSNLLGIGFWDPVSAAIVVLAAVLMMSYEVLLKQRGFAGNVTIAVLTGMLFLLGGAVCGDVMAVVPMAFMAMLVNVGREVSKDIEDEDSDKGRRTLPMVIGNRNAAAVSAGFFLSGVALSVWPLLAGSLNDLYMVVFAADAMFIYASIIVFRSAHKAQKAAKAAMALALAAFVIGVI